jgi:hypothetical protein
MSSLTKIVLVSAAVLGLGALAATGVSWACGPICVAPVIVFTAFISISQKSLFQASFLLRDRRPCL